MPAKRADSATQTPCTRAAEREQKRIGLNTSERQPSPFPTLTSDRQPQLKGRRRFPQILRKTLRKALCKTRKSAPNTRFRALCTTLWADWPNYWIQLTYLKSDTSFAAEFVQ